MGVHRVAAKTKKTVTYSPHDKAYRPTKADVRRWSELLNWMMFEGKCPKWKDIHIGKLRYYAWCEGHVGKRGRYCSLRLRDKYKSFQAFYCILVHEMCHAAEWIELGDMRHGEFFYTHKEILQKAGVKLHEAY